MKNFRNKIMQFTHWVTAWHEKLFMYLAKRSKESVWFTFLLFFICVYEIVEHFIIPLILLYWGIK
jgi:hypothetical protein